MLILQKPEGLTFEKNIPDIVLQKQNSEISVDITISLGDTDILSENYKFDADGFVSVRQLHEIVSAYLMPNKTVETTHVSTKGLIQAFGFEVATKSVVAFESGGTDQVDQLIIDQDAFQGYLSDNVSPGDTLISIEGNAVNLSVISVDDQTNTVLLSGSLSNVSVGDIVTFETTKTQSAAFSVLHCEADMPAGLSAGTFAGQNFLTRLPREKQTATNRNEYLTYIHFGNYAEVVVKYKAVYLIDGVRTEASGSMLTVAADVDNEDRYITFNASLSVIRQLANLTTERILQYDIWFEEAEVSEVFTFLINDTYFRNKTCFVFENSFGVLETFTATGRTDTKKNVEINLANIQSRYRKTTQDFVAEKTINTGFLSAEEMDWLDDLILSYNVAIYIPGVSGADEEITLTSTDKTDTDENELQAFSFSYRRSRNNHLQFAAAARGIFDDAFDQTFN